MDSLNFDGITTFQQALLLIHSECGLDLPVCVLNAPLFDHDEAFIQYILENCGEFFAFGDDFGGSSLLNLFNTVDTRMATQVKETAKEDLLTFQLLNNPVQNELRYRIKATNADLLNVSLIHINGQVVKKELKQIQSGDQLMMMDISDIQPGAYILHFGSSKLSKSFKVIKL